MAKQTFSVGQVLTAAQMTSLQQTAMLGGAASAKTASYTLVAADAGTAISMTSTSATTITVNTALFAAGDTVQITNLGAGVCTITAGTATVNTSASLALAQYESGTLDFTSTSAAIFIKGAGTAASVPTNNFNYVSANQATTSTSYTDLATSQSVTITTGTKALVMVSMFSYNGTANQSDYMSFAVSGATTIAADDQYAACVANDTNTGSVSTRASIVTLTAGSNTFTAKFKVQGGTGQFTTRYLIVIDMGS